MEWVRSFYTRQSEWIGSPKILGRHRERAATIKRLCGPGIKNVLELGAGDGETAAAMADLGYTVDAVEISPFRAARARELASEPRKGSMAIIEADFYTVELEKIFDVVCYWDGFGVGSDSDQRRLLKRIASAWLAQSSYLLLDICNPLPFIRNAGQEKQAKAVKPIWRSSDFDPMGCRLIDTWKPIGEEEQAITQSIRCYTPVDFILLLEGTGLALHSIEVAGGTLQVESSGYTMQSPLWEERHYLAKLVRTSGPNNEL